LPLGRAWQSEGRLRAAGGGADGGQEQPQPQLQPQEQQPGNLITKKDKSVQSDASAFGDTRTRKLTCCCRLSAWCLLSGTSIGGPSSSSGLPARDTNRAMTQSVM